MKSIRTKLYVFVVTTVLILAICTLAISYFASRVQIDNVYNHITTSTASNFAAMLDGDYLAKLRALAESDEYQAVRHKAIEAEDDDIIRDYLQDKEMWDEYIKIRDDIDTWIANMPEVRYLYVVAHGDENATQDMFLVDDSEQTFYDATGRYEDRETEYLGQDLTKTKPSISYSDEWGWLVSDFVPVYDSEGNCVCIVGCDVEYATVIKERTRFLIYDVVGVVVLSVIVMAGALMFINKTMVMPLQSIAEGIKRFKPSTDTVRSHVINLDIQNNDEIGEIYDNIRDMEISIVDHIKSITDMKEDIEVKEGELTKKDEEIIKLSEASLRDALTHVNNKEAYLQKVKDMENADHDYAVMVIDINNLKQINDMYGHKAGDIYIRGCCQMICNVCKHSTVYRIGGDEFVAVLEGADYENRNILFENLKKNYEDSWTDETQEPWTRFSAAVGLAENASDDHSLDLVFRRADKAMYENKTAFKENYGSYR